jgi:hypothetical protein
VSSTRIREEVKKGRFQEVRELLGNCYYVYLVARPAGETSGSVSLFIENWAIPETGSFDGDIEDIATGRRRHTVLTIGKGCLRVSTSLSRGRLYRFYFVKPCSA